MFLFKFYVYTYLQGKCLAVKLLVIVMVRIAKSEKHKTQVTSNIYWLAFAYI